MLKFLRKYQLILLAVGGSLLMIVFLVGPIIQQIGPTLSDKTVATIHGGTRKISYFDRQRAANEPKLIAQVFPFMFSQPSQGIPGLITLEDEVDHWLLLKMEAEEAGLIGESEDGRLWLEQELASIYALYEKQFELLRQWQGNTQIANIMMRQPETQQAIAQRTADLRTALPARARQIAASQGVPESEVFRMISEARGVVRLMRRHDRAVRPSDREIVEAIKQANDEAIVDYVLVPASKVEQNLGEPTEEELQAHFERFRDELPGSGEMGIGYTLPARVQLGWLVLDHDAMASVVTPDRVEVRKRYNQNRVKYPGSFEEERANVEKEFVDEQVADLMVDADRIIQGRLRAALTGVPRTDGYYDIPETWGGVTMESLAEAVVQDMKDQRGIDVPMPGITYRVEKWFTSDELSQLTGIGRAFWQIGPQQIPISMLPSLARSLGGSKQILVQKRIPVADPPAQDAAGNHYYIVLFGTREQSPPDDWKVEMPDRVRADYQRLKAYELLKDRVPELTALAESEGLTAVADQFKAQVDEEEAPPEEPDPTQDRDLYVSRWAAVSNNSIAPLDYNKALDRKADVPAFRDAVLAAAQTIDPMTPFGAIPAENGTLGVPLPSQQAVVIAQLLSYRPATVSDRYGLSTNQIDSLAQQAFADVENLREHYPFTLEAMKQRMQFEYTRRGTGDDEDEVPAE